MNRTAQLAIAYAAGRIAFGVALTALPARVGAAWIGADARRQPPQVPIRGLGMRDVARGGGLVLAALRGDDMKPWLLGCVASDVVDVGSILAASDSVPGQARIGTVAVASGSAIAGTTLTLAADGA
ncbi:MAG TPA: hypothetical protein VI111_05415 [Thermoleophilaceae bacterium]